MPQVHELCSHIQNSFARKLAQMSVRETKHNFLICRVLLNQGFISSIRRGSRAGPDSEPVQTTNENKPNRRYWLDLKYHENKPVLTKMACVSKPSRRVTAKLPELKRVLSGQRVGLLKPVEPGEVLILATSKGVVDMHEAIRLNVGGEVMCRVK